MCRPVSQRCRSIGVPRSEPPLFTVNGEVMGHAISLTSASVAGQREDRRLSHEVHSSYVLVQIREHWTERRLTTRGRYVLDLVRVYPLKCRSR
jgi:hypothetical protein